MPKKRKSKSGIALAVFGVILAALLVAVFLLQNKNSRNTASEPQLPSRTTQSSADVMQEEKSIEGIVKDALMHTIVVETEDGKTYEFDTSRADIVAGSNGILLGEAVTVYFFGELDPSRTAQNVEAYSIVVGDIQSSQAVSETEPSSPEPSVPDAEEQVQRILDDMSLEEKVGQMFIARCPESNAAQKAEQYHLGGYILFARDFEGKSEGQVIENIKSYQNASVIPMLIGVDEEGGTVNRVSRYQEFRERPFQSPQELYQVGGFDAIRSDTVEKCRLLQRLGINLNFAPVCDVSVNPNNFMYDRTFGRDARQTAQYVETVVSAMKGQRMGCVLKHFPGYGNNEDTHTGIAYDNRPYSTFAESDFLPFQAGVEAGADVVLVSHNIVGCMDSRYPASLSPKIHEILREEIGFSGVIVTDDLVMDGVRDFADDEQVAVLAVQAGNDLLCCTDFETQIPAVLQAVRDGTIAESWIDESVLRILKLKCSLGLL